MSTFKNQADHLSFRGRQPYYTAYVEVEVVPGNYFDFMVNVMFRLRIGHKEIQNFSWSVQGDYEMV